jgi:glycosyltransferase involved in cell wall biosynthesis
MDLSLIIPAFNESTKIENDIRAANDFFIAHRLKGEILIIDDGSEDETLLKAQQAGDKVITPVRVLRVEPQRGKGFAVRTGMLASQSAFVMFADSGLCVPFIYALRGMQLIQSGKCDIAHGSRKLEESVIHRPQPWHRRIISRVMRLIFIYGLGIPRLSDTQCGFKIYRGEIANTLYGSSRCNGFLFDIEIIVLAQQKGYRIAEFPLEWTADLDSRLSAIKSFKKVLKELIRTHKVLKQIRKHNHVSE